MRKTILISDLIVVKQTNHTKSLLPVAFYSESTNIEDHPVLCVRSDCMENLKDEKNAPWLSVPQFGDWDQKGPLPDYSLDFSKIREMRKQNKREISRTSIGNEEDLISSNKAKLDTAQPSAPNLHYNEDHQSPNVQNRRSLLSCFNCCLKA